MWSILYMRVTLIPAVALRTGKIINGLRVFERGENLDTREHARQVFAYVCRQDLGQNLKL